MKFLVLFAICLVSPAFCAYAAHGGYSGPLATPVVNPNGFLADTPAVAAAKAAHFAEFSKTGNAPAPAYNAPAPSYNSAPAYNAPAPSYNSAPAYNAPAPSYNSAPAYSAPNYYRAPEQPAPVYESAPAPTGHYSGPVAKTVVTASGFLADTPEVAAEKAAHFSLVAKAQSAQGRSGAAEQYDDGSYKPEAYNQGEHSGYTAPAPAYSAPSYSAPSYSAPSYSAPSYSAPSYSAPAPSYSSPAPATYNGGYHGPQASPVVTPTGFLADTPEVAAAKAAHFSEVAKNQGQGHGRYRRGIYLAHTPAHTVYAAPYYAYTTPYTHYGYTVRVHG